DPIDPCRSDRQKAAPKRLTKRADRQLSRFAKADDDGAGRPCVRIKHNRARPDWTRIETHPALRRQSAVENLIETRLRASESVAVVVTDKERIACEGKVSADDDEFDWRAPLLRFGLLTLVH